MKLRHRPKETFPTMPFQVNRATGCKAAKEALMKVRHRPKETLINTPFQVKRATGHKTPEEGMGMPGKSSTGSA